MALAEELKKALAQFPERADQGSELARLRDFLNEMKDAGVVTPRGYDLPRPDMVGKPAAPVHPPGESSVETANQQYSRDRAATRRVRA